MMLDRAIRRVEALVFRYPIAKPVRTSFGVMHDRPAVFIRIEDEDGVTGWGEAWCNFPSVGAEHRARLVNELLAPMIVDQVVHPREAFEKLSARTAVLALQSGEAGPIAQAIAGVDIALWDLAARRAGKPLWAFLGGNSPRLRAYASGINPDQPERTVASLSRRGHRAFKVKIGFSEDTDSRNLAAVRQELGTEALLAADANQAWDLEHAIVLCRRLEAYGLQWIEEPLRADRPWSEWQALSRSTSLSLAAGENLGSKEAFSEALAQGALAIVQPDAAKWGGISGCRDIAQMIVQAGRTYCPHYLGGGIGLLASAHLLAAVGGEGMLELDANENPLRDRLCGPINEIREGRVLLGQEPGLGVAPDLQQLDRFQVRMQPIVKQARKGWRRFLNRLTRPLHTERYEPAKHYMRGPGPKSRELLARPPR